MRAGVKDKTLISTKQLNAREINFTPFIANESKVGRNHYLHVPEEYLPETRKGVILEANVARTSAPDKEFHLYTSLDFKDPHICISSLSPSRRETFLVKSLRPYEITCFVRDFNQHKSDDFESVTMSISDTRVLIKVDESEVEIKQPRLTSDGGGAILHGILDGAANRGTVRIAKRFDEYRFVFADHHAGITHMKGIGDKIEVTYSMCFREPYQHVRVIDARSLRQPWNPANNDANGRILELDRSDMSRKEIRAWIDTEGSIDSSPPGKGGPQINVSQKFREPLEAFVRGIEQLGVKCAIHRDKRTGQYVARIVDYVGVARVISEVGPFRCPQRNQQVRRLIEHLNMPRKERRRVAEKAKTLLGLSFDKIFAKTQMAFG
jgi:hypothetical protein